MRKSNLRGNFISGRFIADYSNRAKELWGVAFGVGRLMALK